MPDVRLSESQAQGFDAVIVENGVVSLTIVPEPGGKITRMRVLLSEDATLRLYSSVPATLLSEEAEYWWPLRVRAGGWSGTGGQPYYNLALEPCIGAQDSLQEAVSATDSTGRSRHAACASGGWKHTSARCDHAPLWGIRDAV
ncbi:MAG: hypothetical protein M3Q29_15690 [Chloroflexota bacterium]|nr:hypothetical protein [Chloroflexota bacterium]